MSKFSQERWTSAVDPVIIKKMSFAFAACENMTFLFFSKPICRRVHNQRFGKSNNG